MAQKVTLKAIIDVAGKPSQAVEEALENVSTQLEEKENIEIIEILKAEPELQNKASGMYTAFLEIELEFKYIRDAMNFVVEYLPTSIEILEPAKLSVTNEELTDVINDMAHFQIKNINEIHRLKVANFGLNKELKQLKNKEI